MRIARLLCCLFLIVGTSAIPVQSRAQVAVGISVRFGPPVLPVYVQPICPGPGFIWVPGYWAYGDDGYFWVPGTWVEPPEVGLLWTPGYWGFDDGFYIWHAGYWGPEVGFYGGINYGFGYPGVGFYGGYWRGGSFFYNRAVTNVNVEVVRNTYETRVFNNNTTINRVSFNGGPGGVNVRPTSGELRAQNQRHVEMTSAQMQQRQIASANRTMLASVNHGRPDVAATPRPGQFSGRGTVPANNRPLNTNRPPENAPVNHPSANRDRNRPDRPPTLQPRENAPVNPAATAKQQQEMQKMQQKQDQQRQRIEQEQTRQQQKQAQERQKLEQQQSREQQKLVQQHANQQRQQQLQQRQQQQVQQLQRRHDQQTQKLQQRQQQQAQRPPARPSKPEKPHGQ